MSPLVLVANWFEDRRSGRHRFRRDLEKFRASLDARRDELATARRRGAHRAPPRRARPRRPRPPRRAAHDRSVGPRTRRARLPPPARRAGHGADARHRTARARRRRGPARGGGGGRRGQHRGRRGADHRRPRRDRRVRRPRFGCPRRRRRLGTGRAVGVPAQPGGPHDRRRRVGRVTAGRLDEVAPPPPFGDVAAPRRPRRHDDGSGRRARRPAARGHRVPHVGPRARARDLGAGRGSSPSSTAGSTPTRPPSPTSSSTARRPGSASSGSPRPRPMSPARRRWCWRPGSRAPHSPACCGRPIRRCLPAPSRWSSCAPTSPTASPARWRPSATPRRHRWRRRSRAPSRCSTCSASGCRPRRG